MGIGMRALFPEHCFCPAVAFLREVLEDLQNNVSDASDELIFDASAL